MAVLLARQERWFARAGEGKAYPHGQLVKNHHGLLTSHFSMGRGSLIEDLRADFLH